MKAVLAPVGTRGDVQPVVALGQRMSGAGHDVTVAAAENFRGLVEGAGLRYVYGGRDVEREVRERGEAVANPLTLLSYARTLVEEQFEVLEKACEGADVLVGTLLLVSGPTIGERFGIPVCIASFFPGCAPNDEIPSPFSSLGRSPRWVNRATWRMQGLVLNATLRGPVNRHRQRLGFSPVSDLVDYVQNGATTLLATDVELAPPPAEWNGRHRVTGFWFLDSPTPLPEDLEAFLDAGDPPVYIGFGSMPNDDPVARTEIIAEACTTVGCRAIVSSGWANLGGGSLSSRIRTIGPVNHRLLFERVAATVHHGGAGTTAASALAGVPQVMVPHIFDQFYWADRVERLGLGPAALPKHFRTAELVRALRFALEDTATQERAKRMGSRLSSYSGADRAVVLLEKLVAGAL